MIFARFDVITHAIWDRTVHRKVESGIMWFAYVIQLKEVPINDILVCHTFALRASSVFVVGV